MRAVAGVLGVVGLIGCGDPEVAPLEDPCEDAPVLTWANFGQGFLIENCQACHASTSRARQGAPDGVVFDTEEDAWQWSERILVRTGGASPDMPPQGGVDEDDRQRLRLWLECGG